MKYSLGYDSANNVLILKAEDGSQVVYRPKNISLSEFFRQAETLLTASTEKMLTYLDTHGIKGKLTSEQVGYSEISKSLPEVHPMGGHPRFRESVTSDSLGDLTPAVLPAGKLYIVPDNDEEEDYADVRAIAHGGQMKESFIEGDEVFCTAYDKDVKGVIEWIEDNTAMVRYSDGSRDIESVSELKPWSHVEVAEGFGKPSVSYRFDSEDTAKRMAGYLDRDGIDFVLKGSLITFTNKTSLNNFETRYLAKMPEGSKAVKESEEVYRGPSAGYDTDFAPHDEWVKREEGQLTNPIVIPKVRTGTVSQSPSVQGNRFPHYSATGGFREDNTESTDYDGWLKGLEQYPGCEVFSDNSSGMIIAMKDGRVIGQWNTQGGSGWYVESPDTPTIEAVVIRNYSELTTEEFEGFSAAFKDKVVNRINGVHEAYEIGSRSIDVWKTRRGWYVDFKSRT